MSDEWTLDFGNVRPITANERQHWGAKAKRVAALRESAAWLTKAAKIPFLRCCEVELHLVPSDRRRRDADNLAPTLKPICDGIVDAGVVMDDTPDLMVKRMPLIDPPGTPRIYVIVREAAS